METSVRNLMFDLSAKKDIYDAEQERVISNSEANDVLRNSCYELLGLNAKSSERDIKRALKTPQAREFFNVIEEILDPQIATGWKDNEFFNDFVESRNLADGDMNEFWTQQDIILNVAKVSGDAHDLISQKLNSGSSFTVPTNHYAIKVGHDIRMFLTGRQNWSDFLDAVVKAYTKMIQDEIYTEFMDAASKLPVQTGFVGTGTLSSSTKDEFDEIISNVSMANESDVVIMGTKTALKKLNALAGNGSVDWISDATKQQVADTGILGTYEGTTLLEIPQRFKNNDVAHKLVDNTKLFIMPLVDYKPVKFIDYGETSLEISEAGDTQNDQQTYEVQRRMGTGVIITRYFGEWKLA